MAEQNAKSRPWQSGYHIGKSNVALNGVDGMTKAELSDFWAGYHLGQRDKRNDALMDELEAANGR
jgi:hypothetical protein